MLTYIHTKHPSKPEEKKPFSGNALRGAGCSVHIVECRYLCTTMTSTKALYPSILLLADPQEFPSTALKPRAFTGCDCASCMNTNITRRSSAPFQAVPLSHDDRLENFKQFTLLTCTQKVGMLCRGFEACCSTRAPARTMNACIIAVKRNINAQSPLFWHSNYPVCEC